MTPVSRLGALSLSLIVIACEPKASTRPAPAPASVTAPANGRVEITVDDQGYHPSTVRSAPGRALTLVFRRADALNCGEKLRFPSLGLERDLPVGQSVEVAVTTPASGALAFTCGMNMYRGSVVVQ